MVVKALLEALAKGLQISNGPQSMVLRSDGSVFLFCDDPGCCDCDMSVAEASEYLADDAEWAIVTESRG